jgi:hypothetical protein
LVPPISTPMYVPELVFVISIFSMFYLERNRETHYYDNYHM